MFKKTVEARILKEKKSLTELLQETLQKQWDEVREEMFKFPYFNNWPETAVRQCYINSNLRTYGQHEIIQGKDTANVPITHFILEGKCIVVQRLVIRKKIVGSQLVYYLHKNQTLSTVGRRNFESVLMQTAHLSAGACIGLGERLSRHVILTTTEVKCLVVPQHILLQTFTPNNIWQRIILFLNMTYPTTGEVFDAFLQGRRWLKVKKELVEGARVRQIPTGTSIHDTPVSSRLTDLVYSHWFRPAARDPFFLMGDKEYKKRRHQEGEEMDDQTKSHSINFIKQFLTDIEEEEGKGENTQD